MTDYYNNKIPYALNKDGVLVHVDSVSNGNSCGCICPACKKPLQARNAGLIKRHHFAHQSGVECPTAYETVMHLLAKEKNTSNQKKRLPLKNKSLQRK